MIRRAAGLGLVVVFLLLWEPNSLDPMHRLALPALLAFGAWLVVANLAAVTLAVLALASIHTDLSADDPVRALVYPGVAVLAALTAAALYGRRFIAYMRATRGARRRDSTG